mgnify:FL=1
MYLFIAFTRLILHVAVFAHISSAKGTFTPQNQQHELSGNSPSNGVKSGPFSPPPGVRRDFAKAWWCWKESLSEIKCLSSAVSGDEGFSTDDSDSGEENREGNYKSNSPVIISPLPPPKMYASGSSIYLDAVIPPSTVLVHKLNDVLPQVLPSGQTLLMSDLPHGVHTLEVQLVDGGSGDAVSRRIETTFQVGEIVPFLPSGVDVDNVVMIEARKGASESTRSWYSVYPHHLPLRNLVLGIDDFDDGSDKSGEEEENGNNPRMDLSQFPEITICPTDYLLYRTPIHGLNNQRVDVINAVIIAAHVGRTLVLPYLFGDLISSGEGGGGVVDFGDVFDVEFTKMKLEGKVCVVTFDEMVERAESAQEVADKVVDEIVGKMVTLRHSNLETIEYYRNLFAGSEGISHILLDRPIDQLTHFPLNTMNLPVMSASVRNSLRFSSEIRRIGEAIVEGMGGDGGFIALHARVEKDWREHSKRMERRLYDKVDYWFSGKEIHERIRSLWGTTGKKDSVANGIDIKDERTQNKTNLFIAVGEDEDAISELQAFYDDPNVRIFRKSEFVDLSSITHIVRSALDMFISSRSEMFVGSSLSSMSNEVAMDRWGMGLGSWIYNAESGRVEERTDGGWLIDACDVTADVARREVLREVKRRGRKQARNAPRHPKSVVVQNPYPIVRADVTRNGDIGVEKQGERFTYVLFEGEDVDASLSNFCRGLFSFREEIEDCKSKMMMRVKDGMGRNEERARAEKETRGYCDGRMFDGIEVEAVVNSVMNRRCAYASRQLPFRDCAFGGTFHQKVTEIAAEVVFPSMADLGIETTTDKITHHGYHRFYEHHFEKYRARPNLRIFEIGLARGSSMNLWCGYFPTAEIVGVDITLHPDCFPCELASGVYVYSGDAGQEDLLRRMIGTETQKFDIIVDDGSHLPEHQLLAFNILFDAGLKFGGKYVIEDIETSFWNDGILYNNVIDGNNINIVEIFKSFADVVNKEFFDPYLESQVESIEFGANCIILTKVSEDIHDHDGNPRHAQAGYYNRIYRMAEFVKGYNYGTNDGNDGE